MSSPVVLTQILYTARHKHVRISLVAAVLGIMGAVVTVFALWLPARYAHEGLVDAVDAKRRVVVETTHARDLARSYGEVAKIIPALESKLARAGGQAELVTQVEKLARRHGVRIVSQAYEEGKSKDAHVPLFLELALQGSYGALRQFLHDIPLLPMWSEVQELRLERSREHGGKLRAQVRIVTYRQAMVATTGAS